MSIACRIRLGILGMTLAAGLTSVAFSQATGSAPAPAASSASSPATPAAKKPSVAELMPKKTVDFDFEGATAADILTYIGKSYNLKVEDAFEPELSDRMTIKLSSLSASEAVNILNAGMQPKGYAIVETVRTDEGEPRVVLTVLQIKKDAGNLVPVFSGMDPTTIPEGNEVRTQVMMLKYADLEKYRDMISSVLGKDASININSETKTLIVTDTGTHIHTLVSLLQVLDKAPAEGGKSGAGRAFKPAANEI